MRKRALALALVCCIAAVGGTAAAGVLYLDPPGGWTYIYDGLGTATADTAALDGTWVHNTGADEWAKNAPGGSPLGGVVSLEGYYLRIEDASSLTSGSSNNRKICFAHDTTQDGAPNNLLDAGVTLTFRARLPQNPIDLTGPNGYLVHDGGKDIFGIKQTTGGNKLISFTLAVPSDLTGLTSAALLTNDLNGATVTANVDQQDSDGGTLNKIDIADPTVWHEFWINIVADATGTGTHIVSVWIDGSLTPINLFVTAGNGSDITNSYISMGCGSSPQLGGVDIDFYGYRVGLYQPVLTSSIPEPATVGLLGIGLALAARRRRRH